MLTVQSIQLSALPMFLVSTPPHKLNMLTSICYGVIVCDYQAVKLYFLSLNMNDFISVKCISVESYNEKPFWDILVTRGHKNKVMSDKHAYFHNCHQLFLVFCIDNESLQSFCSSMTIIFYALHVILSTNSAAFVLKYNSGKSLENSQWVSSIHNSTNNSTIA